MDGWMDEMSRFFGQGPISGGGSLYPLRNLAMVSLCEPPVTCYVDSYLVFRFLIEVVSSSSSGIG